MGGNKDVWSEQSSATLNQSAFATSKAALNLSQSTQLTAYATAAGTDNMTLVLPPSDSDGKWAFNGIGMYWAVSSRSEHPKEAAELVNYLVNDMEAGKVLGTERGIPVNNNIRKTLAESATGTDKTVLEYVDVFQKKVGDAPEIIPNGASDIMNLNIRYQQDVVFGNLTAAQAAAGMIKDLQNNIDAA